MLANFTVRTILVGLVLLNLTPVAPFAQTPPPKKESELVAAGNKPLTGQQIIALFLGNTGYATTLAPTQGGPAGAKFTAFYRDARTRIVAPTAGGDVFKTFEANWWIEGNQICHEMRVLRQGNNCASVHQVSSAIYLCGKDGECGIMYRIVPGNPEKL